MFWGINKMARLRRIVLVGLITISCCLLPLSCLPVLMILNPMGAIFVTSFTVENKSAETLKITPVGTIGKTKALLPTFSRWIPFLPAIKNRNFNLKPGQSVRIIYDWDDINFSEIAVDTKDGKYYQVVVDKTPTENQYHRTSGCFIIPSRSKMEPIQPDVLAALQLPNRFFTRFLIITVLGITPPILLIRLVHVYRRDKKESRTLADNQVQE